MAKWFFLIFTAIALISAVFGFRIVNGAGSGDERAGGIVFYAIAAMFGLAAAATVIVAALT